MITKSTLFAGVLLAALAFAAACDDESEAIPEAPRIRGTITTLTPGSGDVLATILIEGEVEPDTAYDKASVRVDGETEVYRIEGGEEIEASAVDLAEGQTVEAWFEGPVAESYPVQAYAGRIVILD